MERRLTFHSMSLLYLLNFLSCACYPPLYTHWSFPGGTSGKLSTCQCRRHNRLEFDPWSGRSLGVGSGNPCQYSCLENTMDREAWWAAVPGAAKSRRRLSNWALYTRGRKWERCFRAKESNLPSSWEALGTILYVFWFQLPLAGHWLYFDCSADGSGCTHGDLMEGLSISPSSWVPA